MEIERITAELNGALGAIICSPGAEYVYNPTLYAAKPHLEYWRRYGAPKGRVLLVGMNPGPWGMAQTGVPFGDVGMVAGWLGITEQVGRPAVEHPARRIEGFGVRRGEVSGKRLWGWAKKRFGTPEEFFARFFVVNYCPLLFLDAGGRNVTPDKLPTTARRAIEEACDKALLRIVRKLSPRLVVGVGGYAEKAASRALLSLDVTVGRITHPSPANPAANRGWETLVEGELKTMGAL